VIGRRGFLGTLAGMLLGAKLGPKILPAPSPDIWRAAPRLPMFPRENRYVALHQFLGRMIEVVHEETKWLRLERAIAEPIRRDWLYGDTIAMRPPVVFTPHIDIDWSHHNDRLLCDRIEPVSLIHRVDVPVDLGELAWDVPLGQFSKCNIEPLGLKMADQIARTVKRTGGAGLLLCAEMNSVMGAHRCVTIRNEDYGLAIRGTEVISPYTDVPERDAHILHIEMLFGLA
jgi:hypothetical protein